MSAKFFFTILLLMTSLQAVAQAVHPRTIINREAIPEIRERLEREPYRSFFNNLLRVTHAQQSELQDAAFDPYDHSSLMANQAYLYLLTGEQQWADDAFETAQLVVADSVFFNNSFSFGLTRAFMLRQTAYAYDFCYNGWTEDQRRQVNDKLYRLMYSVNASMGRSANYAIESNWMGVRYGSVILASYAWDAPVGAAPRENPAQALRWDAQKRLGEHLEQSIFSNGWNGESMSYHIYGWSFVGPALLALQNNLSSFELADFAPKTIHTLHGIMTSTVAIQHKDIRGMQADLSDDDLVFATRGVLGMAFALYPKEQLGALKWMYHYLIDPASHPGGEGQLIYSILYYPEEVKAQNPSELGWLTYHDPEQGVVISRDRFQDENDIVSTYNARATRIRGHAGPDANTFRLIGEGVPWIIGGGRTGLTAGQSNLFPGQEATAERDNKGLGILHDFRFKQDSPAAYAVGSGSCVGTEDHKRIHYTTFGSETDASVVVVVKDVSKNGRRWRINTPEFNELTEYEEGFLLTAPNGASMRVQILEPQAPLRIESDLVRYGGETKRHNPGIWYQGKSYTHSRYIDVYCDGKVNAVISVQPAGEAHPEVVLSSPTQVMVGKEEIRLPDFEQILGSR